MTNRSFCLFGSILRRCLSGFFVVVAAWLSTYAQAGCVADPGRRRVLITTIRGEPGTNGRSGFNANNNSLIRSSSGNITVNGNGNFDFEGGTTSYTIDVVANDGTTDSNVETITINITDENDAPILAASGPFDIPEDAADTDAVGTINVATDQDVPADTITYSISGGTGAGLFSIDNSGNITVNGNGNFDFEGGTTSYTIDVVANDGTTDSNTETITINITDENDAPILPASGPFDIPEDAADTDAVGTINLATDQDVPADAITYSISGGTGAGLFSIDNSGNITVNGNGNFDFETTTSYTIDVVANDGTTDSNTETITIDITNVNDAPVLPASGPFNLGENAGDTDAVLLIRRFSEASVAARSRRNEPHPKDAIASLQSNFNDCRTLGG